MPDPLVHLVVTVVADQEGRALRGEVVVFVGTEGMHREALDLEQGPYELTRAALALHEAGCEAVDVLSATKDTAPPSPAAQGEPKQRQPRRRKDQAPARQQGEDQGEDDAQTAQFVLTSTRPRSRRR